MHTHPTDTPVVMVTMRTGRAFSAMEKLNRIQHPPVVYTESNTSKLKHPGNCGHRNKQKLM